MFTNSLTPAVEILQISQMVCQGIWTKNPLLQLPHMEGVLKKKKSSSALTIVQFLKLSEDQRNTFVNSVTPQQKQDIDAVCKMLPSDIDFEYSFAVDGQNEITAGSVISATITFTRPSTKPSVHKAKENQGKEPIESELLEAHTPYLPYKKNEVWWVFISEDKPNSPILGFTSVRVLTHEKEISMFLRPREAGEYKVIISLVSDCYVGFDRKKHGKLSVKKGSETRTN